MLLSDGNFAFNSRYPPCLAIPNLFSQDNKTDAGGGGKEGGDTVYDDRSLSITHDEREVRHH